jgi:hypothetical protein
MRELDQACEEVMRNVEGSVACGIVELATGKLLGFHAQNRAPELEAAIAAATISMLCRGPGGLAQPAAQEAHVVSDQGYHFAKVLEGGKAAVMLVTSRTANVALGSAQMKAVIPKVDTNVP